MTEDTQKDPYFAKKFVEAKLIQIAKEAAGVGISADVFEALIIALTDELDFKDIVKN
ncbi:MULTISPECIES: hypothetical protein [Commensalibacter]|uniref:Uncharacterized protein n=1 Tax=Commensalibacter papalotli (ex Botero et al. 2024) TaxID=2972766 RepID=A0ABM9HRB3_9PROT|nr:MULTISPECIES: hypothetical protein [Commensalibacter]CAI3942424.1 unnamed protein product [Commensalibacter papalotli (ex Botero et al. 2024)]CAI3948552.1 unnamed protein product [Commensalibacter papalotli (ex Botero et al. 2024)]